MKIFLVHSRFGIPTDPDVFKFFAYAIDEEGVLTAKEPFDTEEEVNSFKQNPSQEWLERWNNLYGENNYQLELTYTTMRELFQSRPDIKNKNHNS